MPLVTRSSVQGNLYRQATAPVGPNTGDVWVDTDNGQVFTYSGSAWVQQTLGALGTANQRFSVNSLGTALEWGLALDPESNATIEGQTLKLSEWFIL